MVERFSTGGRGPLGVPTNSPASDPGTSAMIQHKPNVPLQAASLPWDHDGKPRARGGLNRTARTVQFPELQMGTRGQDVQRLQRLLNSRLDSDTDLRVDGIYGPKTRAAVIEFQKESDLKPDGIVGRSTWFALISTEPDSTSKPKPAKSSTRGTGILAAGSIPSPDSEITPRVTATPTEKSVDEWSLKERFEYVLTHTGAHLAPDLRAQFTALLTPTNIGIMVGSLVVWAAGHFCGVSELTDAFLLGFGLVFLGRAALDVAGYLKNFIELTCSASTKAELEDAASDLAKAIAILGVVAFFSLLTKVSRAIGDKLETAKKTAPPADEEAAPEPGTPKPKSDAAKPPRKASNPLSSGRTPKASEIEAWAQEQGWSRSQTPNGPIKYTDGNGVVRVTIKKGSPRAPGSGDPHVELRNANGERVDPKGNPVTRRSRDNHTPIDWDL